MAKRRWTFVLVPHGSEPSKIVEVSYRALKALSGGAVLGLVGLLLLGYATFSRGTDLTRTARLKQENSQLSQELTELNERLASLSDTLVRISQRDARIRVLANLEPIDPEVQAAGIGGPTIPAPTGDASNAIRRSHEIRVDLNALIRRANLLSMSFREAADSLSVHSAPSRRHPVDHADPGLADQRLLLDARAPDPARRAAARGHRRDGPDAAPRSRRRRRAS